MTWKFLIPAGIIASMLMIFGLFKQPMKSVPQKENRMDLRQQMDSSKSNTSIKPANGNIDDTFDTFLKAATEEQTAANHEESSVVFLKGDVQAASEFGQIANENDF